MASFNVGDRVRVVDREPSTADAKSGLYYAYFSNLTGTVERVYDDNTLCIDVNIDTLPEDVALRHNEMQTAARDKWIAGLSGEQRNRLTEQDKQFKMSYKVVVAEADVLPGGKGSPKSGKTAETKKSDTKVDGATPAEPESAKSEEAAELSAAAPGKQTASASTDKAQPAATSADQNATPKRLTEKEIAAKEREFLKSLKTKQSDGESDAMGSR